MIWKRMYKRVSMSRVCCLQKCLSKRERIVLELHYGILDGRARHQHEIARHLNISGSYVSRVEKYAIQMISDWLQKGEGEGTSDNIREVEFLKVSGDKAVPTPWLRLNMFYNCFSEIAAVVFAFLSTDCTEVCLKYSR